MFGCYNSFNLGNPILAQVGQQIVNFPLPQPDNFGICDNFNGPSFMQEVPSQPCKQRITNL